MWELVRTFCILVGLKISDILWFSYRAVYLSIVQIDEIGSQNSYDVNVKSKKDFK